MRNNRRKIKSWCLNYTIEEGALLRQHFVNKRKFKSEPYKLCTIEASLPEIYLFMSAIKGVAYILELTSVCHLSSKFLGHCVFSKASSSLHNTTTIIIIKPNTQLTGRLHNYTNKCRFVRSSNLSVIPKCFYQVLSSSIHTVSFFISKRKPVYTDREAPLKTMKHFHLSPVNVSVNKEEKTSSNILQRRRPIR